VLLTEHNFEAQTAAQFIYSVSSVAAKKVGSVQGRAIFYLNKKIMYHL
jgi:hypothetical protein